MVFHIMKQIAVCCRRPLINKTLRFYGIYEPPYLSKPREGAPFYPVLNIQMRGYVYPLLENYQSFIHRIAKTLDIDVEDSFAYPHKEYKVERYKKNSAIVDSEYALKLYERDIQISNVSTTTCPILIRILEATLPEGVSLHIDKYDSDLGKKRYIPDKDLLDMKSELTEMRKPRT
ncbi:PREDICTED: 39S ribosomal protein L48, mitochondrial [Dufourea novaeangliae]|uniref:39S ribosomal protein L48, mitochondrial n=1 Tax=Dufourea novaeangliae TaxID=178035 RepID=UPI000767628D|nr:PREDICTED: 39S ribosomal protein L48, mitochondrial [Dufourea novaeangliae]